ncbi:MAG: hypothetical protein QM747_20430 [Nocardioides sp.]
MITAVAPSVTTTPGRTAPVLSMSAPSTRTLVPELATRIPAPMPAKSSRPLPSKEIVGSLMS